MGGGCDVVLAMVCDVRYVMPCLWCVHCTSTSTPTQLLTTTHNHHFSPQQQYPHTHNNSPPHMHNNSPPHMHNNSPPHTHNNTQHPPTTTTTQGRWERVWHSARSVFSSGRTDNRGEIEHNLRQLADDVAAEFSSEARDFWQATETMANEQQRVLFAKLNSHIRGLAASIASTIDVALDVQLEPVDLSLTPPDAQQFHLDLQALLAAGMVQHTREEQVYSDRRPCNDSLCALSGFFGGGGCDACRAQQYTRLVAEYEVSPERVQAFFVQGIDDAIDKSCRCVWGG